MNEIYNQIEKKKQSINDLENKKKQEETELNQFYIQILDAIAQKIKNIFFSETVSDLKIFPKINNNGFIIDTIPVLPDEILKEFVFFYDSFNGKTFQHLIGGNYFIEVNCLDQYFFAITNNNIIINIDSENAIIYTNGIIDNESLKIMSDFKRCYFTSVPTKILNISNERSFWDSSWYFFNGEEEESLHGKDIFVYLEQLEKNSRIKELNSLNKSRTRK